MGNAPGVMSGLRQWVGYMLLQVPGKDKPDKVPINPHTCRGASSKNPGTWGSIDEARAVIGQTGSCKRNGETASGTISGIGFVFAANGGIVGVDLDHCIENGRLNPWAAAWVERFNSYTEISPSGAGVHIFCLGQLPGKSVKKPQAEMYDRARYFTFTGDIYDHERPIRAAQDAIDTLYAELTSAGAMRKPTERATVGGGVPVDLDDAALIEKIKRSKNGAAFSALWAGDTSGYKSHSEADLAMCNILAWWLNKDAARVDRLFRQSGLYRADKWNRPTAGSTYGTITIMEAVNTTQGGYDPCAHFQRKADQITAPTPDGSVKLADLHPEKNDRYGWNDIGNGNLFADWYKDIARYVPERKKWFVYRGKAWEPDTGNLRTMELCKRLADALVIYALSLPDGATRDDYREFVERWQKRYNRETILKDAASVYPVRLDEFDRDPFLYNCLNGTLDLRTRQFRPHSPADMLSIISGVKYDPAVRSELWEKTVYDVMQGDMDKAVFLQKAMGYGLTGDTSEECLFMLYGPTTRNGKGTVMETYMRMQGGYGRAARPETIAQKDKPNSSGPTEDIARLAGARVVNISEPGKQMVLSAALVKTLTGRDTINARFLNENSFEFLPNFKLFINTNHLPKVTDVTVFSSGRVKVIPFERHFDDKEQDKGLKGRLSQPKNLSGVLNWCLDGLWLSRETGLEAPAAVLAATAQYRNDSDKIARFVDEMMEPDVTGEIRTEDAYRAYQEWCTRNGQLPEGMPSFKQSMEAHTTVKRKRPNGSGKDTNKFWFIRYMKWRVGQHGSAIS